jgi:hypothetical protein
MTNASIKKPMLVINCYVSIFLLYYRVSNSFNSYLKPIELSDLSQAASSLIMAYVGDQFVHHSDLN